MFPVLPLGFAAVCEWWCRSFKISARDLQDALPEDAHVEPLQLGFCGDGLSAGLVV